jgi:E3 ubiquitin-protein ligase SHPRH
LRYLRINNLSKSTLKGQIAKELTIPPQTRYLVPVELGPVERQVYIFVSFCYLVVLKSTTKAYDQSLELALGQLGFDARGVVARSGWDINIGSLRNWLRTLRGIATHPQVGQLQNQREHLLAKPGVLKSISEVLDVSGCLSGRPPLC